MPYVNPKTSPKHDYNHALSQTTSIPTTIHQHLTTLPDIVTIDRAINRSYSFNSRIYTDGTDTDGTVAVAPATAVAATADAMPTRYSYSNSNMQSNINSIFIPASTSKYPIKQSTITEDFRERFSSFVKQWKKAFVYLSRK